VHSVDCHTALHAVAMCSERACRRQRLGIGRRGGMTTPVGLAPGSIGSQLMTFLYNVRINSCVRGNYTVLMESYHFRFSLLTHRPQHFPTRNVSPPRNHYTSSQEPTFLPKVQIHFADFPYSPYSN
jgi:hypothetical protein